jgi:hypothetical protein
MTDETCCGACGYPVHATKEMACDWCRQTADRIEALTAELAKAVEGLHAVVQHEASTFFGPDGEKNKRASWRGVMRKVRATLAEIKGKSHD